MPSKNYCKPPCHLYQQSFRRRSCDVQNREPCLVQPHDRKKYSTAPVLEQSEQRESAGGGGLHLMHVDLDSAPMALINTTVDPGINLKNCPSGKPCGKFCRISKEVHSPNNPAEEITRSDKVEGGKKLGSVNGGGFPVRVVSSLPDKKEGGHSQKGVGCETKNYHCRKNRSSSNHLSTLCSPQIKFGLLFHLPPLACSYLLPTPVNFVRLYTFPPPSVRKQMKQPAGLHTPHNNALPPPQYQQIPPHRSFSRPFTFQRSLHFTPSPGSSGTCEPMSVMPHNMRDLWMFSVPPPLTGAAGIGDVGASGLAQFREHQQRLPASRGFVGGDVQLPFQPPANLLQQYGDALVSPFDHLQSVPSRGSEAERFSALSSEIWSFCSSSSLQSDRVPLAVGGLVSISLMALGDGVEAPTPVALAEYFLPAPESVVAPLLSELTFLQCHVKSSVGQEFVGIPEWSLFFVKQIMKGVMLEKGMLECELHGGGRRASGDYTFTVFLAFEVNHEADFRSNSNIRSVCSSYAGGDLCTSALLGFGSIVRIGIVLTWLELVYVDGYVAVHGFL
ncbi:unnamed protein product [Notodromas monacha]|uniref:Uncharacterized protein n=1 Tax=Notodromas monacha TaxID=399045 RepID=A0A7R9BP18_9CRUS|nr:unnamed protein product [Notodromas monacha]CAG0917687.1 unnamed protein product [Notodromas monacha]